MESWRRFFDTAVLWTLPEGLGGTSVVFLLAFFVAVPWCSFDSICRIAGGAGRSRDAVVLFAAANLLYVAIVSNTADLGENQRFKFTVEPLLWAFLALWLQGLVRTRSEANPRRA